ncbi:hypothetical protein Dimus_026010 [Dionaea muscipula]
MLHVSIADGSRFPPLMASGRRAIQIVAFSSQTTALLHTSRVGGGGCFNSLLHPQHITSRLINRRHISQLLKPNGKRRFIIDTLALVRSLERQGVPLKQAEAITSAITQVLDESLHNVSITYVSKSEMQKPSLLRLRASLVLGPGRGLVLPGFTILPDQCGSAAFD